LEKPIACYRQLPVGTHNVREALLVEFDPVDGIRAESQKHILRSAIERIVTKPSHRPLVALQSPVISGKLALAVAPPTKMSPFAGFNLRTNAASSAEPPNNWQNQFCRLIDFKTTRPGARPKLV
jgi:hypothetical protein